MKKRVNSTKPEPVITCLKCYHWSNMPDIAYNEIHESVKQCGGGHIVKAETRVCHKYLTEKPVLKRRKIFAM